MTSPLKSTKLIKNIKGKSISKKKPLVFIDKVDNQFVVRFLDEEKDNSIFCRVKSYVRALQVVKRQGFNLQLNFNEEENKFTVPGINVLSLFNGLGSIWLALDKLGIKIHKRYSSELDLFANTINDKNYPDTIQLGDVTKVETSKLSSIDLLVGGSPCQGFSFAGKQLNFEDPRSKLFFEFVRIKNEVQPKYFLFENTRMNKKAQNVISHYLGVQPLEINSARVSAQQRKRLYWTNIQLGQADLFGNTLISSIPQPPKKKVCIADILQDLDEVEEKYYLKQGSKYLRKIEASIESSDVFFDKQQRVIKLDKKGRKKKNQKQASCLTGGGHSGGNHSDMDIICINPKTKYYDRTYQQDRVYDKKGKSPCLTASLSKLIIKDKLKLRRYTPLECERLQTIPDNYTKGVSDTQRYKMLGNAWTIDVVSHILSFM